MAYFGKRSERVLAECHRDLVRVARDVVQIFDCAAVEGHREKAKQDYYYQTGRSKVRWPNSAHNRSPSWAIHLVPYPIDWSDRDRFHYFAGYVMCIAQELGVALRWGGDWDRDQQTRDNRFDDLAHFELVGPKPGLRGLPQS